MQYPLGKIVYPTVKGPLLLPDQWEK